MQPPVGKQMSEVINPRDMPITAWYYEEEYILA